MLDQRRHDQPAAIARAIVEQFAAEFLNAAGLGGQHIGDVLGSSQADDMGKGRLKRHCTGAVFRFGGFSLSASSRAMPGQHAEQPDEADLPVRQGHQAREQLAPLGRAGKGEQAPITSIRPRARPETVARHASYFWRRGAPPSGAAPWP